MIKIVEFLQKNNIEITSPSSSLGTRSLIRCFLNVGNLNSSFLDESLIDALFDDMMANVSKNYRDHILQFKKYVQDNWTSENSLFKDWSIFNTSMTCNNVSETTNAKIGHGLPNAKSISLPKFIAQVKLIFYTNQERIEKWNKGILQPQKAPFTKFKNATIVLLNLKLFTDEIDVISYLILIVDVNGIDKKEERKQVLRKILETCDSTVVYKRKLYLLGKNYHVKKEFDVEKKRFMGWIENEMKVESTIGKFIKCFSGNPRDEIDLSSMLSDSGETDSYAIELAIQQRQSESITNAINLFDEKSQPKGAITTGEQQHQFEAISFRKYIQIEKQKSKLGKKFNDLIENSGLTVIMPNTLQQGVDQFRIGTEDKLSGVGPILTTKRKEGDMVREITDAVLSRMRDIMREELEIFAKENRMEEKKGNEQQQMETEEKQRMRGYSEQELESMMRRVVSEEFEKQMKEFKTKRTLYETPNGN